VDKKRLAQILGMLGSAHDGEIINAARVATRLIREADVTWEQLLSGVGHSDEFVQRVASESYQAGLADGRAAAAPKPKRKTFSGYASLLLKEHPDALTDWETAFCLSWTQKRCEPSDKQLAVFVRLAEKTGQPIPTSLLVGLHDIGL
jgi:hypothetical protein